MKNAIALLIFCMAAIQTASCVKKLVKLLYVDTTEYSKVTMEGYDPMHRAIVTATVLADLNDKDKKLTILKEDIEFSATGKTLLVARDNIRDNLIDFDYLLKLPTGAMMVYTGPYKPEEAVTMLDQKTLALQVDRTTGFADENEHTTKLLATEKLWLGVIPPNTGADNTIVGEGSGASSPKEPKNPERKSVLRALRKTRSRPFVHRNSVILGPPSLKYAYENLFVMNQLILDVC